MQSENQKQPIVLNDDFSSKAKPSLIDAIKFFKSTYKSLLIFWGVGFMVSLGCLALMPNKYEATANIAMAQIAVGDSMKSLGMSIEEPPVLISRLSLPTSFSPEVLSVCTPVNDRNASTEVMKHIRLTLVKGVANVVALNTFGDSPEMALSCADAMFKLIQITQDDLVAPYLLEARTKLEDSEERLAKAKNLVSKGEKLGSLNGAAYLSTRDEINYLLDRIDSLKNIVVRSSNRSTHLIAPIYVNKTPISPNKSLVLAVGCLSGLLIGLLIVALRLVLARAK